MENYDEDFSTLKAPPSQFIRPARQPNPWKSDIPLGEGDTTLRGGNKLSRMQLDDFDDDDDFADEFESAVQHRSVPQGSHDNLPEAFLSDSSNRSPSRASASSAASLSSVSSVPTSWDQDDDIGFDFDDNEMKNPKLELAARFKSRQQRAQQEAAAEAARLSQVARKKKLRYADQVNSEDEDLTLGLDLEQLTLRVKTGTAHRNVRLQTPQTPTQSKMLRGMRSIAQLPNQRSAKDFSSPLRLRAAQSMVDLGRGAAPATVAEAAGPRTGTAPTPTRQRPLTAYKEPARKPSKAEWGRQKSKQPNLIKNTTQTLSRQVRNGMTLNPLTGMWEGNELDEMRFETLADGIRPTLIPKTRSDAQQVSNNGMVFDNRTLLWVYENEDEYDDPFAGIDDMPSAPPQMLPQASHPDLPAAQAPRHGMGARHFTNESMASTTSTASMAQFGRSVTRPESSDREVFEVSTRQAMEWRHADERFMRKFGKWIGGEEEEADALLSDQQFYEMVRNT